MIDLGLTAAQRRQYLRALHNDQDSRVRVLIFDANEKPSRSFSVPTSVVLAGQVNVDAGAAVTRSLSLTLLDPNRTLVVDPDSPGVNALFVNDFLSVRHEVWVPDLKDWVACPVFFGPITGVRRDDATVTIEAQGKEALHLAPAALWQTASYKKGANVTGAIKDLLTRAGERRFDIDATKHALPREVSVARYEEPWKAAREMARGIDRQLFFDARGRVRLRQRPNRPVFTFYAREIDGGMPPIVLSRPRVSHNLDFRNIVVVVGPDPGGKKERVRAVAEPDKTHPLSPRAIAFNGRPRYLLERVENANIKRKAEAEKIAARILDDRMRIGVEVAFEALPLPFLEENDLVGLVTEDGARVEFRLRTFTFPLTPEPMSVGYLKASRGHRQRRRKKGGKR